MAAGSLPVTVFRQQEVEQVREGSGAGGELATDWEVVV